MKNKKTTKRKNTTLKIGGHDYTLVYTDDPLGSKDLGMTDRTKNQIAIYSKLPQSQRDVTLLHEILHTINGELDHVLLDSLSEQIYQVLKDNKMRF